MKLIIGLVGEKGSGKGTFTSILVCLFPNKKIAHIRFSDLLRETLDAWNLPLTRHNLQRISIIMIKEYGANTLSDAVKNRILKEEADIVVLDGIRWQADLKLLRSFPHSKLIYITADLKTRYHRLSIRNENKDEKTTSFKKFEQEEQAKTEIDIQKIGKKADIKIENNGKISEFKQKVRDLLSIVIVF